jgi:transcriptional regulator with XRE-family HTH domain
MRSFDGALPAGVHRRAQLSQRVKDELERLTGELAEARNRQGMGQTELADRIGTSQAQVSKLESGQHVPIADTLIAHVLALGGRIVLEFPGDWQADFSDM